MRAPDFWHAGQGGAAAVLLAPLGWCYTLATRLRLAMGEPWRAPVPVVCIGNLVAGGTGKTPVAIALARRLKARGRRPHLLSRGHGGREAGPLQVDTSRHRAIDVGDEPLLLAEAAPTWIARDRAAGARAAVAAGADCILMDDGFQNPSLAKDLSLIVIDGGYGFGNGRAIPAGPLREPVAAGLARADAVVLIGEDRHNVIERIAAQRHAPLILRARVIPDPEAVAALKDRPVVAFAGIARPERFFSTLESIGCRVLSRHAFSDHHPFSEAEAVAMIEAAGREGAVAVTTAKDHVRLPEDLRRQVSALTIAHRFDDEAGLDRLLDRLPERK